MTGRRPADRAAAGCAASSTSASGSTSARADRQGAPLRARRRHRHRPAPGDPHRPAAGRDRLRAEQPRLARARPPRPAVAADAGAGAAASDRLRPWLVLVVVEAEHAKLRAARRAAAAGADLPPSRAARPRGFVGCGRTRRSPSTARRPTRELDDAAHHRPSATCRGCCRPRRLQRRHALPRLRRARPSSPAARPVWPRPSTTPTTTQLRPRVDARATARSQLPVYYSWQFATGPEGDFESLVRRLAPRAMPADARPARDGHLAPGGGHAGARPREPRVRRARPRGRAALDPPPSPTEWDPRARRAFAAALEPRLRRPRGRVAPPIYGCASTRRRPRAGADGAPRWLRDLNLDPRHRAAAAFGARVVQHHQEALMAAAWEQAERIREANAALRQGQLARSAAAGAARRG